MCLQSSECKANALQHHVYLIRLSAKMVAEDKEEDTVH